jgi:hypothetical protein
MSKPASKTLIGVFVLGALVLAVIALVVFGSGKFFERRITYVMYFEYRFSCGISWCQDRFGKRYRVKS